MSAHELDHLAIAVSSWTPAGELLHRELGARWGSGFTMPAFNPCQLALAHDMRVELLEAGRDEHSFVRRFLTENSGQAAPHHITFKVQDIHAAMGAARAAGIEPILVNLEHPAWQEAFLHPKDTGLGFLAQMVQAPLSVEELGAEADWSRPCPWDQEERAPASLEAIYGLVSNLDKAGRVLLEVLGANELDLPGEPGTRGFRWLEGSDLLLAESRDSSGIQAIGVIHPGATSVRANHPPGVGRVLDSGYWAPELGLRIVDLEHPEFVR